MAHWSKPQSKAPDMVSTMDFLSCIPLYRHLLSGWAWGWPQCWSTDRANTLNEKRKREKECVQGILKEFPLCCISETNGHSLQSNRLCKVSNQKWKARKGMIERRSAPRLIPRCRRVVWQWPRITIKIIVLAELSPSHLFLVPSFSSTLSLYSLSQPICDLSHLFQIRELQEKVHR